MRTGPLMIVGSGVSGPRIIAVFVGVLLVMSLLMLTLGRDAPQAGLPAPAVLGAAFEDHQAGSEVRAEQARVPSSPASEARERHTHLVVRIIAGGALYLPPLGLGITDRGRQLAIHTHDRTGVVHIHQAQGTAMFTFSQLAGVWGVSFETGRLAGQPARAWMNGRLVGLTADLQLIDRGDLVIELRGPPRAKPPLAAFDWDTIPLADS
jgi:hypothetical protein